MGSQNFVEARCQLALEERDRREPIQEHTSCEVVLIRKGPKVCELYYLYSIGFDLLNIDQIIFIVEIFNITQDFPISTIKSG